MVDDLIAYLAADDEVFLIPNASNTAEVVADPGGCGARGRRGRRTGTATTRVLAVQGPRSAALLDALGLPSELEYMAFDDDRARRRGPHRLPHRLHRRARLRARGAVGRRRLRSGTRCSPRARRFGVLPCGLGARDTLRTEMGYPLHGQDLSLEITPVQARAGWAVGWSKPAFHGRDALVAEKERGPVRRRVGLVALERGIPRPHMTVTTAEGAPLGEITSGTFSPTLKVGIALALLSTSAGLEVGDEVLVDVRGRAQRFAVTTPPFVDRSTR